MTMRNTPHPDDERLAAYAGGDSEALADTSLVSHLSACDRCPALVHELSLLRAALAELPDLAPLRPLRLIPPIAAPAVSAAGPRSWLRRLTAPAMAAGAGLVLVGAVGIGASGGLGGQLGAAAGPPQEASATNREGPAGADSPSLVPGDTNGKPSYGRSQEPGSEVAIPSPSPKATAEDISGGEDPSAASSPERPWLTLLIAGVGLFGISAALRFSLSPRAP